MKEKIYNLAIRKRQDTNDYFWKHDDYVFTKIEINSFGGRYWFADPFLYEYNNNLYVFYEAYDIVEKKGKIGYSVLKEYGFSDPQIIIDEKCHLSFPYIFKFSHDIYIMPESSGDYDLKLYRAISFPDKWEVSQKALHDVFACDSIIVSKDSETYLLTNEMFHNAPYGKSPACWVKNYLYKANGLVINDVGIKVAEGDYGTRNAGAILYIDDKIFRIGQDCRNGIYGNGMVLSEIKSLMPYEEKCVNAWDCKDIAPHISGVFEDIVGCHTYNVSEHYEIIDYGIVSKLSTSVRVKQLFCSSIFIVKKILRRLKNL